MGKRIIKLTEQDLRKIISKVLEEQNENNFDKLKSHPLWIRINKVWNGDINTLPSVIKKVLPKLDITKLENMKDKVLKMSSSEKLKLISKNFNINEQSYGYGREQPGYGPLYALVLGFMAYVAYENFPNVVQKQKQSRKDREQQLRDKEQQLRDEELRKKEEQEKLKELERQKYLDLYGDLESLNKKTINLYLDPSEQKLVKKISVKDIEFNPRTDGSSYLTFVENGLPQITYTIACTYNPSKFEERIHREKSGSDFEQRIVKIIDNPSYDANFVYNSKFTNELNNRFSKFCKKPDADFATTRQQTNRKLS